MRVFVLYLQMTCQTYGLTHFLFNPLILHAKIHLLSVSACGQLSAIMRQNSSISRLLLDKTFSIECGDCG